MFFKPTVWDLVKMFWLNLWSPPSRELELPPLKKAAMSRAEMSTQNFGVIYGRAQMVPFNTCPTCKRPY